MCERWDDFGAFLSDMGPRPPMCTIDRIDVEGHYDPGNCRWATKKTQANNKRTNVHITVGGVTKTLQEWADKTGIGACTIRNRMVSGWPIGRLLDPVRR